ncbi:U-box domain-containing protein 7 [Argentina anserina]|uniref:U-box domain-containing protein 7 n=1 Tax=Argentina anserina TaxID=57926 RepID=UPI0021761F97|nr:U-box domain-containing protein 7 [Potentilla anserina]
MSDSTASSSSPPIWLYSYIKLRFFNRIQRFLRSKNSNRKRNTTASDPHHFDTLSLRPTKVMVKASRNESNDHKDDGLGLQRAVKKLHFGSWEEKELAAEEIGTLAKDDVKLRKLVGGLGVIPVLVSMVSSEVVDHRRVAVFALVQLANGTYTNKALIVEAGIFSKLPKDINILDEPTRRQFAELLMLLSSLANTPFPLPSSDIVPFLVRILESDSSNVETKQSCLGALHNLSAMLDNAGDLVSNGVVDTLLMLSSDKEMSEKALATLGNLVVTLMGKKAMENSPLVPESLIEILTWDEKSKCQELSSYILMILAHQSSVQREKMNKSGIVPVLLEVALLGSSLAQKRALKLLQWFKDERQTKMGPHSGPQTARFAFGSPVNPHAAEQGKKMMKNLVKQSLHKNMEMITQRASASGDSSKIKALIISTSSKSLPY